MPLRKRESLASRLFAIGWLIAILFGQTAAHAACFETKGLTWGTDLIKKEWIFFYEKDAAGNSHKKYGLFLGWRGDTVGIYPRMAESLYVPEEVCIKQWIETNHGEYVVLRIVRYEGASGRGAAPSAGPASAAPVEMARCECTNGSSVEGSMAMGANCRSFCRTLGAQVKHQTGGR